ncbi:unnamed protein product [Ascophyllum nodosum]
MAHPTGRLLSSCAVASRLALTLFLAMLAMLADLTLARGIVPGPTVQEGLFVKNNWIFKREFFFKRDQPRNGQDVVDMRANRLAKFGKSGEVGYWKVERRAPPGAKRNLKLALQNGFDILVLDVPEQGDRKDLIVSYEIPVTRGRYHPSAIMFAEEGKIFVARAKEELTGAAAAARKNIGTFKVDLATLPPIVDRTFTL